MKHHAMEPAPRNEKRSRDNATAIATTKSDWARNNNTTKVEKTRGKKAQKEKKSKEKKEQQSMNRNKDEIALKRISLLQKINIAWNGHCHIWDLIRKDIEPPAVGEEER